MIARLVTNRINFNKNKTISARVLSNTEISVSFRLSIPAWVKDDELIKQDNQKIVYASNVKKQIRGYVVNMSNLKSGYPRVTNNKYFICEKTYDISAWLTDGVDFQLLLYKEREKELIELKANIILENIGFLSKQWQDTLDGNLPIIKSRIQYGPTKYNSKVNEEFYGRKSPLIEVSDKMPF